MGASLLCSPRLVARRCPFPLRHLRVRVPVPAGPWCCRRPSLSLLLLPLILVVVRPPLVSVVRAGVVPVVPMMAVGWVRVVFLSRLSLLLVGVLVLSRWWFWWRRRGPLVLFVLVLVVM
jgi:hypothetical protein